MYSLLFSNCFSILHLHFTRSTLTKLQKAFSCAMSGRKRVCAAVGERFYWMYAWQSCSVTDGYDVSILVIIYNHTYFLPVVLLCPPLYIWYELSCLRIFHSDVCSSFICFKLLKVNLLVIFFGVASPRWRISITGRAVCGVKVFKALYLLYIVILFTEADMYAIFTLHTLQRRIYYWICYVFHRT